MSSSLLSRPASSRWRRVSALTPSPLSTSSRPLPTSSARATTTEYSPRPHSSTMSETDRVPSTRASSAQSARLTDGSLSGASATARTVSGVGMCFSTDDQVSSRVRASVTTSSTGLVTPTSSMLTSSWTNSKSPSSQRSRSKTVSMMCSVTRAVRSSGSMSSASLSARATPTSGSSTTRETASPSESSSTVPLPAMRRPSDTRAKSEAPPVSWPSASQTAPWASARRRCRPPVFFVMLSREKMSGRLKASSEPSSLTVDLVWATDRGQCGDQDQVGGSEAGTVVPFGR